MRWWRQTSSENQIEVAADYYSLISRAVAALETNTFDDRRAIYNRARSM